MQLVRFRKALSILLLFMTLGSESEQTEVNRLPAGNREKRPKWTKSNILSRFQEKQRSTVEALLDATGISLEEKMDFFKMIIEKDANLYLDVFSYLNDKGEAEVSKPSVHISPCQEESEYNFLKLMSENKRIMMSKLVNDESNLLEKLIAREKEDVQQAFEKWKLAGRPKSILTIFTPSKENEQPPSGKYKPEDAPPRKLSTHSDDTPSIQTDGGTESVDDSMMNEGPPQIDTSFLKNLPKCLTILVLGQTGSGKSTFINAIVNYLKYSSISEAEQKGIAILIKAAFTHVRENCEDVRIECKPTIEVECQGENYDDEEEVTVVGESSTQSPKSYLFSFGPEGNQKKIRIIDTPGVGDVRGLGQERKNFDKILKFIANFKTIHAICILLKSNESRHTVTFRYCINELLAHLHVSASRNIIFGFTNARASLYTPGESLPTLREHLNKLRAEKDVEIQLNRETMFCFDNESFRFLCTHSKDMQFSKRDINEFNYSWNKSVVETFRMFKRISELQPHKVTKTLSVNNIRRVLFAFVRPMAEIARTQLINDDMIRDREEEVENYIKTGKELKGRLTSKEVVIVPKELDYPVTVCTGKDCVEYKRFSDHPKARLETIFKTKCHHHCYLENVKTESYPNPELKKCWAMQMDVNQCRNCGCPWSTHLHIRYELNNVLEEKMDPTVQASIDKNDDKRKTAQILLQQLKKTREEKHEEIVFITKACAELVAFLKRDSILPYNDAFAEYIEHLINEEQQKLNQGGDQIILNQLINYRDDYKEQVRLLSGHQHEGAIRHKLEDVDKIIKKMKKLKHHGSILADIEKIELLGLRKQSGVQGKAVDLNSGWMGEVDVGTASTAEKMKKKVGEKLQQAKTFAQHAM